MKGNDIMSENKEIILTNEGKAKLEAELSHLISVTRKEVSEKIKEARSFGDLSENAEYDEAKNDQAKLENRINEIENLKIAGVISSNPEAQACHCVTVSEFMGSLSSLADGIGLRFQLIDLGLSGVEFGLNERIGLVGASFDQFLLSFDFCAL